MRSLRIVVPTLLVALIAFVVPAMASDVTIDTGVAAQYSYGLFFVSVVAHGPQRLVDAHVLVNGAPVAFDQTDESTSESSYNFGFWKLYRYATEVVKQGDVLTIVVTDVTGGTGTKTTTCIAGSSKKKSDLTAFCP